MTIITKPLLRPTKKQARRRARPSYPTLQPGEAVLVHRPECGWRNDVRNPRPRHRHSFEPLPEVLHANAHEFVFRRDMPEMRRRSKYLPHVGAKQRDRRIGGFKHAAQF